MKRLLMILGLLVLLFLPIYFSQGYAAAADVNTVCNTGAAKNTPVCKDYNGGQTTAVDPIVSTIKVTINVLSIIIGIASVIGIIISAIRLAIANGDSGAITSARSSLVYSLVGLAVVALAQAIVLIVISKLG